MPALQCSCLALLLTALGHSAFCSVAGLQSVVLFKIDGTDWTLDLRPDSTPSVAEGAPPADVKPDLTLTISDDNFAKLVAGKLGPQQV